MKPTINKPVTETALKNYLKTIVPQYEDDEGAFEHMAEVQSVIESLTKSDDEIIKMAEWVGMTNLIIYQE